MTKNDLTKIIEFAKVCDLMDKPFMEVVETWFQDKIEEYESSKVEFIIHTEWDEQKLQKI